MRFLDIRERAQATVDDIGLAVHAHEDVVALKVVVGHALTVQVLEAERSLVDLVLK